MVLSGGSIVSGRPKRRFRRIIGRSVSFLTRPLKRKLKRQASQGIAGLFAEPERLDATTALEKEQKEILKKLKRKKAIKKRAKEIRKLEGLF